MAQELEGESDVVKSGKLSALQLEAIAYACQAHETRLPDGSRAGFFIGDGAGVRHRVVVVVVLVFLLICNRPSHRRQVHVSVFFFQAATTVFA